MFWIEDPKILYNNYQDFIPKKNMTRIEQLNAITRLLIYIVIILIIFGFSHDLCTIPIILIIFVVILYYSYLNDPK